MATNVVPYLCFDGSCEEALAFNTQDLKGQIKTMQRVPDGPKEYQRPGPGTLKDKFGIHWMFNCDKKA
jgi:uncharacterized glyoxalase superfamily protein PhnB